ncbi:MAG TPA: DUF929 family protein [Acidimicrobiales bacterium]|nr:DUF929 family protein [Acidimicrobiales bacterium]
MPTPPPARQRQRLAERRRQQQRLLAGSAIALVVVVVAVLVIIKVTGGSGPSASASGRPYARTPLAAADYDKLTAVSPKVLAAAADNFQTGYPKPRAVRATPLRSDGKPDVLYIGAEFCPYCAAERWALAIALSKFGTFRHLRTIHSARDDGYLPTLTFYGSTYTSRYLTFTPIEDETDTQAPLEKPNAAQQKLWNTYTPNNFPFVDLGGKAVITAAGYNGTLLSGKTPQQAIDQISDGSSTLASNVDATAGAIVSYLCRLTGNQPAGVCSAG